MSVLVSEYAKYAADKMRANAREGLARKQERELDCVLREIELDAYSGKLENSYHIKYDTTIKMLKLLNYKVEKYKPRGTEKGNDFYDDYYKVVWGEY